MNEVVTLLPCSGNVMHLAADSALCKIIYRNIARSIDAAGQARKGNTFKTQRLFKREKKNSQLQYNTAYLKKTEMPQSTENTLESATCTANLRQNKHVNVLNVLVFNVAHCCMWVCFDLSSRLFFECVFFYSPVVHDQHRPHLQPLEELWDPLLCQRSAGLLRWYGVARQHQRCKGADKGAQALHWSLWRTVALKIFKSHTWVS